MTDNLGEPPSLPSRRLAALLPVWSIGLIALAVVAGGKLISNINNDRLESMARHRARVEVSESDRAASAAGDVAKVGANKVRIGVYIDRVVQLSIKDTSWAADFFLWFVWNDKTMDPGETFRVVDGEVQQKEKVKQEELPDGSTYAVYHVRALVTKFFDVSRFPADDHMLTLRIEDSARPSSQLTFVADVENSAISSRVRLPGYRNGPVSVVVKPHAYKTTHGDPRLNKGDQLSFSQFIYGFGITREGVGFFFKVFQGLFAAVAIAFLAFFIKPTDVDPRFGLGVGAFFAGIANCYITAQLLPDTGIMSLADIVNGLGLAVIFLSLVQSTISLYAYDILGQEALARKFDKVSALIFIVSFPVINVAIYWAAVG